MKIRGETEGLRRTSRIPIAIAGVVVLLAALPGFATAAPAIKWTFHAGDAFLRAFDPSFSPVVAEAANGHTLALAGAGTYNPGGPVTGGGVFWHNDSHGNLVHPGTWSADAVLSYEDFGSAVVQGLPRSFHGGQLVLAVTFTTTDGSGITIGGTLTVNCVLGEDIPTGLEEGIMADIPGAISFGESVSGNTLFVLTP